MDFLNPVTVGFALAMLGATAYFWKIRQQVGAVTSIVTVLGVLGTFWGITSGLRNFDSTDIEASIPALLDGLKIAFYTSMCGIGASILIKAIVLHERRAHADDDDFGAATLDDVAQRLAQLAEAQTAAAQDNQEHLRAIERSLVGDGETTLLTQLQKLRTGMLDKQDDLLEAFNAFASDMAENNTNALIEALEGVMRDFNAKINEQFGENFQQLNDAMGKILEWQDQYRQQMDELAAGFQVAAQSVDQSRESLVSITEQTSSIVSSADRLEPVLSAIQDQQGQLEERLTAFSQLRENASEAFPVIEERIQRLTSGFSDLVESAVDTAVSAAQTAQTEANRQRDQLQTTITQASTQIETMAQESSEASQRAASMLTESLNEAFRLATERITQQVAALDAALENELTNALTTLGSQLASLSGRFVQDYEPLTRQLQNVVEIARDLPPTTAQSG